jgi:hypothetical protein
MDKKQTKKEIVNMLLAQDLKEQDESDLIEMLIDEQISVCAFKIEV